MLSKLVLSCFYGTQGKKNYCKILIEILNFLFSCIWKYRLYIKHDDVIKWKHFPRYWPFVRGIHRSTVNSPLKGQWRGALIFSLICAWINGWVNNRVAGYLRRHRAHDDVMVIMSATSDLNVLFCLWFQAFNTLRPRQNGRHFPDDIFKCIFLNENV